MNAKQVIDLAYRFEIASIELNSTARVDKGGKKMDYTTGKRTALLKRMHNVISNISNEDYYMAWIYIMPDEPTEEDFIDIAEDDSIFNEIL